MRLTATRLIGWARGMAVAARARPVSLLLGLSLALHGFSAVAMRARYWYDTIAYFEIATALLDAQRMRALYGGDFGILYGHIMPGVPTLIVAFEALFGARMWVGIAAFQVLLSACAVVFLARSLDGRVRLAWQAALVVLVSLHPFVSAYRNAILTEAVAGSMMMIALGAFLRGLDGRWRVGAAVAVMLAAGLVGAQFRFYIVLFPAAAAVLLVIARARAGRAALLAGIASALVLAVLVFPAYRTLMGVRFFLPNGEPLMLLHASYVAWDLDERQRAMLAGVVLDPDILRRLEGRGNVSYLDSLKMTHDLMASGLTLEQAGQRIGGAATALRLSSPEVIRRQLQSTLSSLGFQQLATCCWGNSPSSRSFPTGADELRHLRTYYQWASGLSPADYGATFDDFISRYRGQPAIYSDRAIDWYASRVGPYVTAAGARMRDPLRLGRISPDIVVIAGLAGLALLAWRNVWIALAIGAMLGSVYGPALLASYVGDNRHSHALVPVYLLGVVILLSAVQVRAVRWAGSLRDLKWRAASPMRPQDDRNPRDRLGKRFR